MFFSASYNFVPISKITLVGRGVKKITNIPSMDPAMVLQYTQHGPLYIGYIFAFYATNVG